MQVMQTLMVTYNFDEHGALANAECRGNRPLNRSKTPQDDLGVSTPKGRASDAVAGQFRATAGHLNQRSDGKVDGFRNETGDL